MSEISNYLAGATVLGVTATALLDLALVARRRWFGTPLPDYALAGRWFAHMPGGRFHHEAIGRTPPARGEALIGWTAHYLIGIAFAGALLGIWGVGWWREPTLAAALIVGIGSVAAPLLLMQPGMGAGFAASRTADPRAARLRSLATHAIFGLCLYAAAWATRGLVPSP